MDNLQQQAEEIFTDARIQEEHHQCAQSKELLLQLQEQALQVTEELRVYHDRILNHQSLTDEKVHFAVALLVHTI